MMQKLLSRYGYIGQPFILGKFGGRKRFRNFKRILIPRRDLRQRQAAIAGLSEGNLPPIPPEKGFVKYTDDDLKVPPELFELAEKLTAGRDLKAEQTSLKAQLKTNLIDPEKLDPGSPLVKFALREDLLSVISRYLGSVPLLNKIDLWYSLPTEKMSTSQFFHCDWESERLVKVFIYLTDVGEDDGPLTLMEARDSEIVRNKTGYHFGSYLSDEQVKKALPTARRYPVTGKRGTVSVADTCSCLHYGSRIKGDSRSRLLFMLRYVPVDAFNLPTRKYQEAQGFPHLQREGLSEQQKLALGAL